MSSESKYLPDLQGAATCIDLFCGAGGLSLGFCQAGGIPVAAVDADSAAMTTYKEMFPVCPETHCGPIEEWEPTTQLGDVDVMIGGPPCQGFSLARGLRFVEDPRNALYKQFVRLVDHVRPKWVVMENVPGILNIGEGIIYQQILEDFSNIGYWLECRVINMAEHGVPQTRTRAIFVGSRIASSFDWPVPSHTARLDLNYGLFSDKCAFLSVAQALGDLPWPMGKYFSHRANSQMRGPRNRRTESDPAFTLRVRGDEFALCENPATSAFAPGPVPKAPFVYRLADHPFQEAMRETPPFWINRENPVEVVCTPVARLTGTRKLASREQARLQTFPDWFRFTGTHYAQGRQIGNAVPPLFGRKLFEHILASIPKAECSKNGLGSQPKLLLK
jgi:DNA (cytosine-5)-methyltransferase 1